MRFADIITGTVVLLIFERSNAAITRNPSNLEVGFDNQKIKTFNNFEKLNFANVQR